MTFAELQVGQKFRCYRWDGHFDPNGPIYTKISPMKYKPSDKQECNCTYQGKRAGLPDRTYFVRANDTDKVELAS
jgi:hypothetical protein